MGMNNRFMAVSMVLTAAVFFTSNAFTSTEGFSFTPSQEQLKDAKTQKDSLPLLLMATVLSAQANRSLAVIRDLSSQNKKQRTYRVKDKISGYQIVNISRGKVNLIKSGKSYTLVFPWGSEFDPVTVISADERVINLTALKKKIPDLLAAITQALTIPHIEHGKITGLKLAKIKDKALASKAGIEEGDVIAKINGKNVDSLRKSLEIYQDIRKQDTIKLELKRGDKVENLTYYMAGVVD